MALIVPDTAIVTPERDKQFAAPSAHSAILDQYDECCCALCAGHGSDGVGDDDEYAPPPTATAAQESQR
jgi:hypothetical protein